MKRIRTNTDYHYISTVKVSNHWVTMVFTRVDDSIDLSGVESAFTTDQEKAIVNHCDAIWKVVTEEAKPKRRRKHK